MIRTEARVHSWTFGAAVNALGSRAPADSQTIEHTCSTDRVWEIVARGQRLPFIHFSNGPPVTADSNHMHFKVPSQ